MATWNTIALIVGWLGSAAFLFPYMLLVKGWRRDAHRVHVVCFSGDVFAFFTLYLLRPLIDPGVFQWIRTVLLWVLALLAVWRAAIFLTGLVRGVRRRRNTPLDVP
jgi:hypothetical protein